ncbi:MAG: hypothetical protein MJE77_00625 [Proteobacteria bacterium]|nr:hypothetical protein [Pseudomonadota bacterium]
MSGARAARPAPRLIDSPATEIRSGGPARYRRALLRRAGIIALALAALVTLAACPRPQSVPATAARASSSVWFRSDVSGALAVSVPDMYLTGFAVTGRASRQAMSSALVRLVSRGDTVMTLAVPPGQSRSGVVPDLYLPGPVELVIDGRVDIALFLRLIASDGGLRPRE